MDGKKVFALALALIMVIPAAGVLVPPAMAATGGVNVLSYVVGPGSPVTFYINLTYLRDALGWVGSEVTLYWSDNGYASLDSGINIKIDLSGAASADDAIYVADVEYVAGTLIAPDPETLSTLLHGEDNGYIYLKVSDGSNTAVSARILVLRDTKPYISISGMDLAYAYGPLDTTNVFKFKANLTEINELLAAEDKDIQFNTTTTFYLVNVSFVSVKGFKYTGFYANVSANTTNNVTSDIFNLDYYYAITNSTSGETILYFNGTLADFPLDVDMGFETTSIGGIPVDYVPFTVTLEIFGNETFLLGNKTRVVDDNYVYADARDTYVLPDQRVSLAYPDKVNIYPSVEYIGFTDNTTANTIPGQINPNDIVTVALHQFPANGYETLVQIYRLTDEGYVPLLATPLNLTSLIPTTGADGSGTLDILLPEAPYGGLSYTIAVQIEGLDGIPMVNTTAHKVLNVPIKPYIEVFAATDDGTFRSTIAGPTAPGDYLLVKGHGFLKEGIDIKAKTTDLLAALFDIAELKSYGATGSVTVFDNGTFIAIGQIDPNAWIDPGAEFVVVACGNETATNNGYHIGTFYFDLGNNVDGVQKVYVNPVPVVVNATYGFIKLGLSPAYPYPAIWEDEANRVFTIEAIGLDAVSFKAVNVTMTDGTHTYTLATNKTPVHGYLMLAPVHVPVVPMGDYNVTVLNATAGLPVEVTAFPQVLVRPTAAVQDPLTGNYSKYISIMAIIKVNAKGYGWPASVYMEWDIEEYKMLGYVNFSVLTLDEAGQAETNASGYFEGLVPLNLYISMPGLYHITFHPEGQPDIASTVTIEIGRMPVLNAYVDTAKTKFVGDYVDVWILVKFDNEPATPDQVPCVKVFVYAMTDAGLQPVNDVEGELAEFTGIDGLWHYSFYLNPTLKGEDIVVRVKVKGAYLEYLPTQYAYDIAVLTVSNNLQNALDDIAAKLDNVETAVGDVQASISDVQASISDLAGQVSSISSTLSNVQTAVSDIQTTLGTVVTDLGELSNSVADLSTKLDTTQQNLQTSMDQLKSSVDQTLKDNLGGISSKITTFGAITAILEIIVLGLIGFTLLRKPQ